MAGIYVHVPFCKVKCHYCDFHFSVQLKNRQELVDALCQEIRERKDYLASEIIETIYFGGGTPSVLESKMIDQIMTTIHENFELSESPEITFECNPDDITQEKLMDFKTFGINRLSIGIQSFDDNVLRFMNRAHSADEAKNAVINAQKFGFDNLTLDLIYGVPGSSMTSWKKELALMDSLQPQHLSAYCLTIEPKTVFGKWSKQGKLTPTEDQESITQFQYLMDFCADKGFEQYEISNFAKEGFISRHNSAYWLGKKYLGIGPSAHSYNGLERSWNIANNIKYSQLISKNETYSESEVLQVTDHFNEYILTRFRTKWGVNLSDLALISAPLTAEFEKKIQSYLASGHVYRENNTYLLTTSGKFIADGITSDLFS
ncbi:MAG: radical SAM family heme chaperone HemW [Crocinitomix sp.]|nr:radical SAM family heme chaperone HemW [Crocinitomix sp.]